MAFSNPQAVKMLALGFLAQNLALGLTYGTYSAFVSRFVEEFNAPLSLAGSGLAVTALVMGLTSPLSGRLVARLSIAKVMVTGALCVALGFALLSVATSMTWVLATFAITGFGMVILGPIPAMALIANWFQADRGKALGLGMLPLGIFVMPPVATLVMTEWGWRVTALAISGVLLVCIPLLLRVQDRPGETAASQTASLAPAEPVATFLRDPRYAVLVFAYAIVAGGGSAITAHMIPLGTYMGFDANRAAVLLSMYGFAAGAGAFTFGWIADRSNGMTALLLNALLHVGSWLLMLASEGYTTAMLAAALMGLGGGGLTVAISSRLAEMYEPQRFSQALGLALALNMPFTFGAAPLLGWLYDTSGTFDVGLMTLVSAYIISTVLFIYLLQAAKKPAF